MGTLPWKSYVCVRAHVFEHVGSGEGVQWGRGAAGRGDGGRQLTFLEEKGHSEGETGEYSR